MGILRSGILGHLSGKTAGVVGGKWKDKSYIREYVIPANPNTTPQQAQRSKFTLCVAFAKALVGQVFNVYVDKFEKSMSGFNRFISSNVALFDGTTDYPVVKITQGKLWPIVITNVGSTGGALLIAWIGTLIGNNGSVNDNIYAAAYDTTTGLWYFPASEVARSVQAITITPGAGGVGHTFQCYAWAAKYSLTSPTLLEMVSNSDHHQRVLE
jgi:hypothetical protein